MDISITTSSIFKKYGAEKACQLIKEAGFTAVDLSFFQSIATEDETVLDKSYDDIKEFYRQEIESIKKNGLEIALAHAPFPAYKKGDPDYTDRCIAIYRKLIRFCDEIDCPYIIIHGISRAFDDDATYQEIDDANMYLFTSLIPELLQTNVKVCLENMFIRKGKVIYAGHCNDPREVNHWIDRLNDVAGKECFAFCLDNGHMNVTNTEIKFFIEICGRRIQTLHLHDNSGNDDNHALPMTGKSDWDGLCHFLGLIGYEGAINFEVGFSRFSESMDRPALEFMSACGRHFEQKIKEAAKC